MLYCTPIERQRTRGSFRRQEGEKLSPETGPSPSIIAGTSMGALGGIAAVGVGKHSAKPK